MEDKETFERYKYNMEILDILKKYLTTYKDIRFSQALYNLNIISDDTKIIFIIQNLNIS